MSITYKRINKDSGNYDVLLDEKNVGSIAGKAKNWKLKNLFGTTISKGITRDRAVKNALENLWEYESEFELFHSTESDQENNPEENLEAEENASPDNTSFLNLNEEVDETIERNDLTDCEPKLCDDYQPMGKESVFRKCARVVNKFLIKIKLAFIKTVSY